MHKRHQSRQLFHVSPSPVVFSINLVLIPNFFSSNPTSPFTFPGHTYKQRTSYSPSHDANITRNINQVNYFASHHSLPPPAVDAHALSALSVHLTPCLLLLQPYPCTAHHPPDLPLKKAPQKNPFRHSVPLRFLFSEMTNSLAYTARSLHTRRRFPLSCTQTSMQPTIKVWGFRSAQSDGNLISMPATQATVTLHSSTSPSYSGTVTTHFFHDHLFKHPKISLHFLGTFSLATAKKYSKTVKSDQS